VAGDRPCFINLTHEFLVGELTLPFGPEQVVLEVPETVAVDDEVIAGIAALVEAGYRIALDDFVWGSSHERLLAGLVRETRRWRRTSGSPRDLRRAGRRVRPDRSGAGRDERVRGGGDLTAIIGAETLAAQYMGRDALVDPRGPGHLETSSGLTKPTAAFKRP
jgi:hypothetical protein